MWEIESPLRKGVFDMKKILNPYLNKEGYNCVCCAPNNPIGLHLEFWEENEDVLTIWKPGENYQGWVNTLHGGIISMLMEIGRAHV